MPALPPHVPIEITAADTSPPAVALIFPCVKGIEVVASGILPVATLSRMPAVPSKIIARWFCEYLQTRDDLKRCADLAFIITKRNITAILQSATRCIYSATA